VIFLVPVLCWVAAAPADEAKPPLFEVAAADGARGAGPLLELGEDWSVRLGGDRPPRVRGSDVLSLRRAGLPLPAPPRGEQVVFVNGDRVPADTSKPESAPTIADDRLLFRPKAPLRLAEDKGLSLPLSVLALLWLAPPDGTDNADLLLRRLAAEQRKSDVVLLRNGDVVQGTLTALDGKTCRVEVEKKEVQVSRAEVAVIAFNTELASRSRPEGAYGHLVLADGCRLALASARLEGGKTLRGKTLGGAEVEVPLGQVAALDLYQGRAVYLSDLKPSSYRHTRFLGLDWPYVPDGSVAGRELRLGGSAYDKGVGMHSASRLTYDLGGKYRRFEALVGLDDQTGRRGRVNVQVLVDDNPQDLGWDKELTARDKPLRIRVDVTKAKRLTLVVGFGRFGDVQGHVDWADARLIK
jgi:hypothetical protein